MAFAEHYLRDPGQFPARRAGEPWGDCEVGFRFAGAAYLFRGMSAAQADQVRERFGSELDAPGNRTPDAVEIAVFQTAPSLFRPVVYEETEYRWDTDYEHRVIRIAGDGFMARIDRRPGLLGALWLPHAAGPFQLNAIENYFRVLVAYQLLERGGILLHSSGIVRHGRAHLFIGPSGAGKTTVARLGLRAGFAVLSDDLNAVLPHAGAVIAEKVPFAGELGRTVTLGGSFPVAGIYRLAKGASNRLEPMSAASTVAALMASAPFLNADPHCTDRLAGNATAMAVAVHTGRLSFTRDGGFWDLLDR